jgi:hypothetical protein
MAKAKVSLKKAVEAATKANSGYRAVSATPTLDAEKPVANITLMKGEDVKNVTEKLDWDSESELSFSGMMCVVVVGDPVNIDKIDPSALPAKAKTKILTLLNQARDSKATCDKQSWPDAAWSRDFCGWSDSVA